MIVRQGARPRRAASLKAELEFRARVAGLGGVLLEPEWLGRAHPHRVLCPVGHECSPRPASLQSGNGLCRTCAGCDPEDARRRFHEYVASLGGTVVEPEWLGGHVQHRVVCAAGHKFSPQPSQILHRKTGLGCAVCSRKDSATAEREFRERVHAVGGEVLEPKWLGCGTPHRARCTAGHECSPRPTAVQRGQGICATCARRDTRVTKRRFYDRVAELGSKVVEPTWLGVKPPHRLVCAAGHEWAVRPSDLLNGYGSCSTCTGRAPDVMERRFQERVAELGGVVLEAAWRGTGARHHVRCPKGHVRFIWPRGVLGGGGLCHTCSLASSDSFYVVANETLGLIKLGITTGKGAGRLCAHRGSGFDAVLRFMRGLDDAAVLEAHVLETLQVAGIRPARGREYFDRAASLAVVFDIVDNWIMT